jgi:hypothetical protein
VTITSWVLSAISDHLNPTARFGAEPRPFRFGLAALNRVQPLSQSPAAQTTAGRPSAAANTDLASLQAYQASQQGLIERDVHELAAATAALVQYAIAPSSRHLVANEANDIAAAALRLRFVLRVLDGEVVP